MNLLSRNRNLLLRSVTPLQQSNAYSTKITYTTENFQHLTDCRTQKSSESSSSFSDRISKQTVRPKPSEIPYQGKVANSVKLIGYVKAPIHFETDSNGNHFAATVISQETKCDKDPLLIPVVFEGDLAHVVAYHVKENNRVLVSGKLSRDPLRFAFSGSVMNCHIVADNLNFVGGFKRNFSKKFRGSFSDVGIEKRGAGKIDESIKIGDDDDEGFDKQWKEALEYAKVKRWGENLESRTEECSDGGDE